MLTFEITYTGSSGDKHFEITLIDYPGEDLLEAMETLNFEARTPLEEQFKRTDYVLVAADPTQDLITPLSNDHKAVRRRQDALVQAIGQLFIKSRKSAKDKNNRRPPQIAVLITKSDIINKGQNVSIDDIIKKNKAFLKNLKQLSSSTVANCFPVSSCGSTIENAQGFALPPETPKPTGYEKLFDWLSREHFRAVHDKKIKRIIAIIVIPVVLIAVYCTWSKYRQSVQIANIKTGSIQQLLAAVPKSGPLSPDVSDALDKRMPDELDHIKTELGNGLSSDRLKELDDKLRKYEDIHGLRQLSEVKKLRDRIERQLDESLYNTIKAAQHTGKDTKTLEYISEYKRKFPSGIHKVEVDNIYKIIVGNQKSAARGRVRGIAISNRNGLASKAREIRNYLKSYGDDVDANDMRRAAEIAEGLASCNKLRIHLKGCGFSESKGKRYHRIKWINKGNEEVMTPYTSDGKRAASTFDWSKELESKDWDRVTIELWDLYHKNEMMASGQLDILEDLAQFDGSNHFKLQNEAPDYWQGVKAYVIIEVQWRKDQRWVPISPKDLKVYGRFIKPGGDW